MTQSTNRRLSSLSSTSCSSQKSIWNVLTTDWRSNHSWLTQILVLNSLWSYLVALSILAAPIDVDFQVDSLILETVLPLDNLSSVFNTQNWSALATVVSTVGWRTSASTVIWLRFSLSIDNALVSILHILSHHIVVLWLATDVTLLFIMSYRSYLVVWNTAWISVLSEVLLLNLALSLSWLNWSSAEWILNKLLLLLLNSCIFASLFRETLLVRGIQVWLIVQFIHAVCFLHFDNIAFGWFHLLRWRCLMSIMTLLTLLCGRVASIVWSLLLVWIHVHFYFLINLDWSITNTKSTSANSKGSIRLVLVSSVFGLIKAQLVVKRTVDLQLNCAGWLVCGRWW